jgi:hypothetical protein
MNTGRSFTFSRNPRPRRKRKDFVAPVRGARLFDFGFTSRRPLVPMAAVELFLNRSRKEVLELIDEGRLRWAFDIRSRVAAAKEVRVLRQSLFEYTGLYEPEPEEATVTADNSLKRVIHLILPEGVVLKPGAVPSQRPGWKDTPRKARAACENGVAFAAGAGLDWGPVLWGTEVAEALGCTAAHVRKLVGQNCLETVALRRAPKASPIITRESVISFLHGRRMS